MNEVERIEKYMKARALMRHMDEAYIHWINAGDDTEAILKASDIQQLLQQRADLLEALKKCRFDSLNMSIDTWRDIQETIQRIDQ